MSGNVHNWQKAVPSNNLYNIHSESNTRSTSNQSISSSVTIGQSTAKLIDTNVNERSLIISDLKNIHARSQSGEKPNILTITITKVYQLFMTAIRLSPFLYSLTKEHNLALMTQEHLTREGSLNFIHKRLFLDLIKNKSGKEFDQLRNGIERMHVIEKAFFLGLTPIGRRLLAKQQFDELQKLKPGEDMWLDLTSVKGRHSMKGRISCIEGENGKNKYVFYMSNTGAGLESQTDFHPSIKDQSGRGKELYQTVAKSVAMNLEDFSFDFFHELAHATIKGKYPTEDKNGQPIKEGLSTGKGPNGESLGPIGAVYSAIRKYVTLDKVNYDADPRLWSREQFQGSCVPSSNWRMAKSVLTEEQNKELRMDPRIRFLQFHYQKIVDGYDQSTAAKIMALDQVRKIVATIEKSGVITPEYEIFKQITADLEKRLGEKDHGLILKSPKKVTISPEDSVAIVQRARFKRVGRLKAEVSLETFKNRNGEDLKINLKWDNEGNPQGLVSNLFMLHDAILNSNDDMIQLTLNNVKGFFNNPDPGQYSDSIAEEIQILAALFSNLSIDLFEVDKTKSGILKSFIISSIAKSLAVMFIAKNETAGALQFAKSIADDYSFMQNARKVAGSPVLVGENNIWAQNLRFMRPFEYQEKWNGLAKKLNNV